MQMEPLDLTTKSNAVKAHVHKPYSEAEAESKKTDAEVRIPRCLFTHLTLHILLVDSSVLFTGKEHISFRVFSGFEPESEVAGRERRGSGAERHLQVHAAGGDVTWRRPAGASPHRRRADPGYVCLRY